MSSRPPTSAELDAFWARIGESMVYLRRSADRLAQRGMPQNDPLMLAILAAEDALHTLRVRVHGRSTGNVRVGGRDSWQVPPQ